MAAFQLFICATLAFFTADAYNNCIIAKSAATRFQVSRPVRLLQSTYDRDCISSLKIDIKKDDKLANSRLATTLFMNPESGDESKSWLTIVKIKFARFLSLLMSILKAPIKLLFRNKVEETQDAITADIVPDDKLLNFPSAIPHKVVADSTAPVKQQLSNHEEARLKEARRYAENILQSLESQRKAVRHEESVSANGTNVSGNFQPAESSTSAMEVIDADTSNHISEATQEDPTVETPMIDESIFINPDENYTSPNEPVPTLNTKKLLVGLSNAELRGKTVLVRCDLNVPMTVNATTGEVSISDDTRIRASLPTLQYLLDHGAKVLVASHLGRPKGNGYEAQYSLAPVAKRLSLLLQHEVPFVPDCKGLPVAAAVAGMQEAQSPQLVLLENVRFYAEEEANDASFAQELAKNVDIYVNDAFGTAHRAHASTAGIAAHVPVAVAGLLLSKEMNYLHAVVEFPNRPFAAIVGGSKVSTKIAVLESLLQKVDTLILGGGMVFTFLKTRGIPVGNSLVEDEHLALARRLEDSAREKNVTLILAEDVVITNNFHDENAQVQTVDVSGGIPDGWQGVDIGPKSIETLRHTLSTMGTILWNGPMGVFEQPRFAQGTFAVAHILANLTSSSGVLSIIGGGDSVAAVEQAGLAAKMSHISTGGGAALEMLEGKVLPGIAALNDQI